MRECSVSGLEGVLITLAPQPDRHRRGGPPEPIGFTTGHARNLAGALPNAIRFGLKDKPHGLVVDYIGVGDELREATATYARGGGRGDVAPDVSESARPVFHEALDEVRRQLPEGVDSGDWRRLSRIDLEDRIARCTATSPTTTSDATTSSRLSTA